MLSDSIGVLSVNDCNVAPLFRRAAQSPVD